MNQEDNNNYSQIYEELSFNRPNPAPTQTPPLVISDSQIERMGNTMVNNLIAGNLGQLKNFSGNIRETTEWLHGFQSLAELCNWSNDLKVSKFEQYLRGPALNWFETWSSLYPHSRDFESMKKSFLSIFSANVGTNRQLHERIQGEKEPAHEYVFDKDRVIRMNFPDIENGVRMSFIINGLRCDIRDALTNNELANIESLVDAAWRIEARKNNLTTSGNNNEEMLRSIAAMISSLAVSKNTDAKVTDPSQPRNNQFTRPTFPRDERGNPLCYNFGRRGHVQRFCQVRNNTGPTNRGGYGPIVRDQNQQRMVPYENQQRGNRLINDNRNFSYGNRYVDINCNYKPAQNFDWRAQDIGRSNKYAPWHQNQQNFAVSSAKYTI